MQLLQKPMKHPHIDTYMVRPKRDPHKEYITHEEFSFCGISHKYSNERPAVNILSHALQSNLHSTGEDIGVFSRTDQFMSDILPIFRL